MASSSPSNRGAGSSSNAAGTKRKRGSDTSKFYAVRAGKTPGVYSSWSDCLQQVTGFKGALFKSFSTLTDAERYVNNKDPAFTARPISTKSYNPKSAAENQKYYAVSKGKIPGIYTDWLPAQAQTVGFKLPKVRAFTTFADAQRFMQEEGTSSQSTSSQKSQQGKKKGKQAANNNNGNIVTGGNNIVTGIPELDDHEFPPGLGPLPIDSIDGFDPSIELDPDTGELVYKSAQKRKAIKMSQVPARNAPIRVHTDGSALGNGQDGATAGLGVYFGPADRRNVSEALPGTRQTNQRAELTAMQRALDIVPKNRDMTIVSDSKYAIDCITDWSNNWRRNGWKTAAGKNVENRDLIEGTLNRIDEKRELGASTQFEWIKGHSKDPGNDEADRLAVDAASKSKNRYN